MIYYIESRDTDPSRNLALEQFVFDSLDRKHNYFMLWQNHNAIIVGKHQNTLEEINAAFVKENGISVVRRLSGGGAVYHDLGNLNFTFITDAGKQGIDFAVFCEPIRNALLSFGVPVEISGRNDMTVDGKKFSGNAQYIKEGRVMHHGTILYDSDMSVLSRALKPGADKIESKGVKSARSRVTNIRPYMKTDMSVAGFWTALKDFMVDAFGMEELTLEPEQDAAVEALKENVYSRWSWNYGNSPPYTLRKARRIEGCGRIEILLDLGKEGVINNAAFYGDFFGSREMPELVDLLRGRHLEREALKEALLGVDISLYFHALDTDAFLALLLE
ncbi:MAG: lipoate--protein ligase [Treponema sp.]|jgi:lipoate-protein ligase A|nr:lipoate--protein ligase [Treponema sp.]